MCGADGVVVRWESRRHRKHLTEASSAGSTWWAPRARGWWIAVLFAAGSLLFALGALPWYLEAAGGYIDSVTFFAGSLFFTSAAFLTYREAVDAAPPIGEKSGASLSGSHGGSIGGQPLCSSWERSTSTSARRAPRWRA